VIKEKKKILPIKNTLMEKYFPRKTKTESLYHLLKGTLKGRFQVETEDAKQKHKSISKFKSVIHTK
jgi:hypothetical protein